MTPDVNLHRFEYVNSCIDNGVTQSWGVRFRRGHKNPNVPNGGGGGV